MKIEIPLGTEVLIEGNLYIVTEKTDCDPNRCDCRICRIGAPFDLIMYSPKERSDEKCVYFRKVKDE